MQNLRLCVTFAFEPLFNDTIKLIFKKMVFTERIKNTAVYTHVWCLQSWLQNMQREKRERQHPLIYIHLQGLGQPDLLGLGTSLASLGKKPQASDFKVGILTIGQTSPI